MVSNRVEVWVADRVTGKVSLREVIRRPEHGAADARIVVLRAVELLRWSLQELRAKEPPPGEIAEPPKEVVELTRGSGLSTTIALAIAPQASYLTGTTSLGAGLELDASMRVGAWGGQVLFAQPVFASQLSTDLGRVEIRSAWVGIEATWDPAPADARFQPRLALGVRGLSMELTGVVEAPLVGRSLRDYAIAPAFHPACVIALTHYFQLFASASAAWMLRQTSVEFAGERAGRFGAWLGTAGMGVRVALDG